MIIFLKELAVLGIALFTAIFGTLSVSTDRAIAPDIELPAVISEQNLKQKSSENNNNVSTSTIEADPGQETNDIVHDNDTLEKRASTQVDPFKELAEAFSRLADEAQEARQTEIPQIQTSNDLNTLTRSALVNIICTTKSAGPLNPISASGVIIDPRGIILTNSHVAQYFLLQDYPSEGFVDCFIRAGSPARAAYSAELLFLPPSWIANNAQKIDDEEPTGNGEYDYAFLLITGEKSETVTKRGALPYLKVALASPALGDTITVAGYPAGFLGGATIQTELYAASANTNVGQLYTFGSQNIDLFSVGGSIVAQQGSSGGPAAREDGALVGLIVTSSVAPETANRDLRALSTEYIIRSFESESGIPLATFLGLNLADQSAIFQNVVAPSLTKALTDVLGN